MKKAILLSCLFLVMGISLASASSFDIVRPIEDIENWDCVSFAVDYCNKNVGYIPCSISFDWTFKKSHMVAIKIIDDETIHIVDNMYNAEYTVHNWQLDGQYYHFWIDEPVKRYWNWKCRQVVDNREMVLH